MSFLKPLQEAGPVAFAIVAPPEGGYVMIESLGPDEVLHVAMTFHPARAGDPVPSGWGAFAEVAEAKRAARDVFGERLSEFQGCPADGTECHEFARRNLPYF